MGCREFTLWRWAILLVCVLTVVGPRPVRGEEVPSDETALPVDVDTIFSGGTPANVDDLRAMQGRIQELSERVMSATVAIRVGGSQGSGVIVSEDGYVLTAAHVVGRSRRRLTFILQDGSTVEGRSLGMNHQLDSGLCKIEEEGPWPYVEMGDSSLLHTGQWVLSAGHPGGYERDRRPVIRVGRMVDNAPTLLRSDCTLVGGDSGGPLFDMEGRVIGIHSRIGASLSANLHVPVDTFRFTWDRLTGGRTWAREDEPGPFAGIKGGKETSGPAEVVRVIPRSPAEEAGLEEGDLILSVDGFEISNLMQVMTLVSGALPGDELEMVVQRGEEQVTLTLELASAGD